MSFTILLAGRSWFWTRQRRRPVRPIGSSQPGQQVFYLLRFGMLGQVGGRIISRTIAARTRPASSGVPRISRSAGYK